MLSTSETFYYGTVNKKWNRGLNRTRTEVDGGFPAHAALSISNIKVLELIAGEFQLSKIKTYKGWEEYACKT